MPRFKNSPYAKACIRSSTRITKVAIIIMKHGTRIFGGITLRRIDTRTFAHTSTNVVATPIPTPFSRVVVTARVGHNPRTRRKGGISSHNPFLNSCAIVFAMIC